MNFQALLRDFIKDLKNKDRADATIIAYRKDIEQLIEYSENHKLYDFNHITTQDLIDFLDKISEVEPLTKKTISRKINSIRTFFKFLRYKKIIKDNPALKVEHPKAIPNTPRILSSLEYRAIRDTARNNLKYYTIIELILQTGLRISEITRLKFSDIKLSSPPIIKVQAYSTNDHRQIELNDIAVKALNEYLLKYDKEDKGFNTPLFYTKNNGPILIRNLRSSLERIFIKAGIKGITVNDLRNTFILYQLQMGLPIEKVAQIAGHKRIATTERYLKLLEKEPDKIQKEIVAL